MAELLLEAFQLAEPVPESITSIPDEAERIEACLALRGRLPVSLSRRWTLTQPALFWIIICPSRDVAVAVLVLVAFKRGGPLFPKRITSVPVKPERIESGPSFCR